MSRVERDGHGADRAIGARSGGSEAALSGGDVVVLEITQATG